MRNNLDKRVVFILNLLIHTVSLTSINVNDLKVNQHVFHVTNRIPCVVFIFDSIMLKLQKKITAGVSFLTSCVTTLCLTLSRSRWTNLARLLMQDSRHLAADQPSHPVP